MTDKMREEFEVWALTNFINSETMKPLARCASEADEYRYSLVNMAWIGWQASRAALVIELPTDIKTMAGPVMYADDVRAAVEAAGLKVKP